MRLAFYTPLKPPDHPIPSGDRRMARLLMQAWEIAGHQIELASKLVSYEPEGSARRQREIAEVAAQERDRLRALFGRHSKPPNAWFTYHVYYKSPDLLGPTLARELAIPYLVAEASIAERRASGPHSAGHRATVEAVRAAARIFIINPADREDLEPVVQGRDRLVDLPAFLDTAAYAKLVPERLALRRALAKSRSLDGAVPWLLSVAMMRPGDKLASYQTLGRALQHLLDLDWRLLVVGDGTARPEVEAALGVLGSGRVCYLGRLNEPDIARCAAAADLCLWPAVNESYGMALLEAQAAGLPVVAGACDGVPSIVAHGETGLLVPPGESEAFAAATRALIEAPGRRAAMDAAALESARGYHDITTTASILDRALAEVCREHEG